jgi:hypothetical protein
MYKEEGLTHSSCPYVDISANHTGLVSPILPCQYVEIRDKCTGLGLAILPCSYVEIREEWLIPIRMIIPDFCIWTRKND